MHIYKKRLQIVSSVIYEAKAQNVLVWQEYYKRNYILTQSMGLSHAPLPYSMKHNT